MKEKKKGRDPVFLWAAGICLVLCLVILGILLLGDPVVGYGARRGALSILSEEGESRVVVSDPSQTGQELFSEAQKVLEEPGAGALRRELHRILSESRWKEMEATVTGVWLPSVSVYTREDMTRVFLGEDTLYLEREGKRISFRVPEEERDAYGALYETVMAELSSVSRSKETP